MIKKIIVKAREEDDLQSLSEMTKDEFDAKMKRALLQAKSGEGMLAEEFFLSLRNEL